ncbi:alpha beta-hydrolase [Leucogyrophana mollusca]|uniref:Alpha beta-hydrolase n=1 Tax=Leucogyrophana mollusca TaxID=85980 RepID=A0ACB8BPY9_9AGAM|nr:alpha beta-hydrolase [Leucogyrophana mollusca]
MSVLNYTGPSDTYRELAELPLPTSAAFTSPQSDVIHVTYSIRDHERNIKRSVAKTYFVVDGGRSVVPPTHHEASDIVGFAISPSKTRQAILREASDQNGSGKKRFVEIWSGTRLEALHDVTKTHGAFHTDDVLSSLSFSPSESALLYTAEANVDAPEGPDADPYPKFRYVPHFGEAAYSKKRPAIFLFRWRSPNESSDFSSSKTKSLTALSPALPAPASVIFAQAVFASEDRVFATGYDYTDDGRLLGIKGCFNRPSGIWELTLPPQLDVDTSDLCASSPCTSLKLTSSGRSCRSPRILRDANGSPTKLLWLSSATGGPHASSVSLHSRNLSPELSEAKLLIDTVWDPAADAFPGLYTEYNLPSRSFLHLSGSAYVVAQSLWKSRTTVLLIDVTTGSVRDVTPAISEDTLYSWNVLCTDGGRQVVCSRSTPTTPSEIVLGRFDERGNVKWKVLDKPTLSPDAERALGELEVSIIPIPNRPSVETIVIQPKRTTEESTPKPLCVTTPHGGPHATSTTAFSPATIALALEGYTLSLPNYTGSMGFGEKYVQKLLGQCGTLDLADCVATVNHLIELGISEPGRQLIQGGSHGGYLAAHLIGQYPDMFNAAVLRNPVVSIGELPCVSDIPDWCYAEFALPFTPRTLMTPEIYQTLYDASPIAHVDNVRTPVLLCLGEDDHRVPPVQGLRYYHALKGRGRVVDVLSFPKECHPIEGVEAARVCWEAGRDWFKAAEKS